MRIDIYTDGACSGNPGPGGFGALIFCEQGHGWESWELSDFAPDTTNNRMELTAVIESIEYAIKRTNAVKSEITITTDSKYVVDAINQNWLTNWQHNGWKTAAKKPVLNQDLWVRLLPLLQNPEHKVTFAWVKGHAGHPENERCDELAVAAIANGTGTSFGTKDDVPANIADTTGEIVTIDNKVLIDVTGLSDEVKAFIRNSIINANKN